MTTKVKGLLRGLRYISQIFDEKEQEMQIGFPTDVKHVAHIGCDGPSATNAPSWMNEFNSPPELLCVTSNSKEEEKSLSTDPPAEGLPFSNDHGSVFLWIKMCAGFYRIIYSVGKKCSLLMLLCFNRHNSD